MQTYEKHIYEVDVIKTYFDISSSFEKVGKENDPLVIQHLEQLESQINILLDRRGLVKELVWSHKLPIVILPSIDVELYTNWLGLFLYGVNPNKVHLILEYHLQHWNLKESFLNRVEFFCLERLNENRILLDNTNGNIMSMWLLRKRELFGYDGVQPTKPMNDKSKSKQKDKKETEPIDVNRSMLNKKIVFSPKKTNNIFQVVKNCLFEESKDNMKLLESLINGENVNTCFKVKYTTTKFTDLFVRLKEAEIIYNQYDKDVAQWIHSHFLFHDMKEKKFKKSSVKTILKTFSREKSIRKKDQIDITSILK